MKLPEKKINVCIISTVHSADDIRIYHKEIKSLKKAGYDVTLIALPPQGIGTLDSLNKSIELKVPKNRLFRMIVASFKVLILSLMQRACIYHFHDPELIPVCLLLKLLGKKVVYDVHEDYSKSL